MSEEDQDKDSVFSTLTNRQRRMTEKGLAYIKEQKEKGLRQSFKTLKAKQDSILKLILENPEIEIVRQEHSQCLTLLEAHYNLRDDYFNLLDEEERKEYDCQINTHENPFILDFKGKLEGWFAQKTVRPGDSVSQGGSRSSRATSVSLARLREEQKKAELMAKASALHEIEQLEMDKLKLKMEEKKLEIKTELAITEAKTKVIEKYEKFLGESQHGSTERAEKGPQELSAVPKVQNSNTVLNPHATLFTSKLGDGQVSDYASIVRHLRKPMADIKKFSGDDPLDYKRFMRQFNSKVVVNTDNVDELVNFLDQFTSGEANKIVTGYSYLDGERAYTAILGEFEERYGDTNIIACAFVKRALDWPVIKADNAKALDEYSIFLTECEHAVQSIDAVKILEYPDNMKRLVMKLPYHYHDRWRNIVQTAREKRNAVEFHTLVNFVRREAKKAVDPIYGKKAMNTEFKPFPFSTKTQNPKNQPTRTKAFATDIVEINARDRKTREVNLNSKPEVKESCPSKTITKAKALDVPCIHCGSSRHGLGSCDQWLLKSHDEKISFLMTKGMCFKCFRCGHRSRECDSKVQCSKCEGTHHTLLHIERNKNQTLPKIRESNETSACASQPSGSMRAGDGECTMAILPVLVRLRDSCKTVETYAFLDPGSSVSFCSDTLMEQLGCEGKQMKITLETMGKPHTMLTHVVHGLEVCEHGGGDFIELPKVYSKDKMPVSQDHIPTQKDISGWPHLHDVSLPHVHSEIGLLIGNNVPDAYTPMLVKAGPRGSPHATKTQLGWVVWNVIRDTGNSENERCFRTEVVALEEIESLRKLDFMVREAINFDFPERMIDDKRESSQDDRCFIEKVSNSIKLVDGHYSIKLPFRNDNV